MPNIKKPAKITDGSAEKRKYEKGNIHVPGQLVPAKKHKYVVDVEYVRDDRSDRPLSESLDAVYDNVEKAVKDVNDAVEIVDNLFDINGKIKAALLPAGIDDIVEGYYYNNSFWYDEEHTEEIEPSTGIIYADITTGIDYRWGGDHYYPYQAQSDWNQSDTTAPDYIKNKPNIPEDQIIHCIGNNGTYPILSSYNDIDNAVSDDNKRTIRLIDLTGLLQNVLYQQGGRFVMIVNGVYKVINLTKHDTYHQDTQYTYNELKDKVLVIKRIYTSYSEYVIQCEPINAELDKPIDDLQEGIFNGDWRTPTKDEWNYLIKTRSASTVAGTANARFIAAQVNDVNGLIILPDVFTLPDGITMSYINNLSPIYNRNIYTLEQWVLLNAAGCIFLPVTGNRYERSVYSQSVKGYYWSSTQSNNMNAWHFYFGNNQPDDITCYVQGKYYGTAVRLIKENNKGLFSISTNIKCTIASSNLQYHCLNKEWRFAPNPYDIIGTDNTNIAEDYNGWIDLFGFGTSGWNSGAVRYQPWSTNSVAPEYINRDLTGEYKKADWGVYNFKKQLHKIAFSGDFNDLENVPLGEANGIAELDINGKVPSSQLPSYVDDVVEGYYDSITDRFYEENTFITVITPVAGKSWVDISTNKSYRWTGTVYTRVDEGVQLGETSNSAYRGDRGKTAYDHATDANRITTAQSSGLYKIAVTAEGHVASVAAATASDIPTQDATETQKGVIELATPAEAIAATDTERAITPKTNDDAFNARFWKGTEAQFEELANKTERVTYYVEVQDDDNSKIHWTNTFSTLVSNSQLKSGDMYAALPSGSTDRRDITNLYLATSSSTYITIWSL